MTELRKSKISSRVILVGAAAVTPVGATFNIEEFESFSRVNGSFFSEAKFERFDLKNRNHS
uniref:hypothetical protein n=1 Tax=Piscirickettsia salmonis TaxID=1238 RepID=UPI0039F69CCB